MSNVYTSQELEIGLINRDQCVLDYLSDQAVSITRKELLNYGNDHSYADLHKAELASEVLRKLSSWLLTERVEHRPGKGFMALLKKRIFNEVRNYVKKDRTRVRHLATYSEINHSEAGPHDIFEGDDWIKAVLNQLPEREATCVWLRLAGYNNTEIGDRLGVSSSTVGRNFEKVRMLLRHLEPE